MATSVLNPTILNFKLAGGDTASSLTASANAIEFNGHASSPIQLRNVAAPSVGSDAVTKTYVDDIKATLESSVNGLSWKSSVTCSTTGALPASAYNSSSHYLEASVNGSMPSQDGVTLQINDRILIKDQTSAAQNGIYKVTSVGSASSKWRVTRTADSNTNSELQSAACFVDQGSVSANKAYVQSADSINSDLVTTALAYVNFSSSNLTGDSSTIQISGSQVSVLPLSITTAQLSTNSVNSLKIIDLNVTDQKINSMNASKLTGSLNTNRIDDGSINGIKIASLNADKLTGLLDMERVYPNSIADEKIAAVSANKITGQLATAQYQDDSVVGGKLANDITISTTSTITANSFTAQSDRRLKENIEPMDDPLEKVLAMEGVTYNFKANKKERRSGVIAQDLELICPELVKEDKKGMRSVNYIDIVPYLIEAIKEMSAAVKELKEKVAQK